ncbi:hypothetical protein A2U01_0039471 [Trifolium medium]|uniref:Uncharacterized protein n=1 Tax=Trifolium medium TaxID=97028 RepID=A0A392Q2Z5_9FABA|nr:hypothetical protein [Trifolium medium]
MKRATEKSSKSQGRKKRSEVATSASKQKNEQRKLKIKQEVPTSDYDETDSDYAEFLKTYDPNKDDSDSSEEEVTKESLKTEESKKDDPELPESGQDSK